jgi:hypothetical protein
MHDPADDPAIVYPLDAAHIPRQIRPNSSPLLVAQPKQILAHDPDPFPKTNQDRILRAQKLMSFDPSNSAIRQFQVSFTATEHAGRKDQH